MGDSVGPSVALSKLLCKVTALENDNRRLQADAEATATAAKAANEEKEVIERTLKASQSKWQEREKEMSILFRHQQDQVTCALEERDRVLIEVDQKKKELETVLHHREAAQIELRKKTHELEHQLKLANESKASMMTEARCQKMMTATLEQELSTIKTRYEEVETALKEQENRMREYFETVQTALVETESLVQKLEEQKGCIESLQGTLAAETMVKTELEQEIRLLKETSVVTDKKMVELETELGDAYRRIKEEQEHRERILELLTSSEDTKIKIEETVEKQTITINQLQQKIKELLEEGERGHEQGNGDDVIAADRESYQQDDCPMQETTMHYNSTIEEDSSLMTQPRSSTHVKSEIKTEMSSPTNPIDTSTFR